MKIIPLILFPFILKVEAADIKNIDLRAKKQIEESNFVKNIDLPVPEMAPKIKQLRGRNKL